MRKLGVTFECLCKGKVPLKIRKPQLFEPVVVKVRCPDCESVYFVKYDRVYGQGTRQLKTSTRLVETTQRLLDYLKKQNQTPKQRAEEEAKALEFWDPTKNPVHLPLNESDVTKLSLPND